MSEKSKTLHSISIDISGLDDRDNEEVEIFSVLILIEDAAL